jgi:hypothetical protein
MHVNAMLSHFPLISNAEGGHTAEDAADAEPNTNTHLLLPLTRQNGVASVQAQPSVLQQSVIFRQAGLEHREKLHYGSYEELVDPPFHS